MCSGVYEKRIESSHFLAVSSNSVAKTPNLLHFTEASVAYNHLMNHARDISDQKWIMVDPYTQRA